MSLIQKIKNRGVKYSFAILFNRIVPQWVFRCRRFVVLQLDETLQPAQDPTGIEVSWCETEPEFQAIEKLTYFSREDSDGDLLACQAKLDDQLVGAFWSASKCFDESELGVRIELEPQQAWLFAALVKKQFRGQGFHNSVLKFIIPGLVGKGFKELLLAVNPDNLGSLHVHKKYSSQTTGTVYAFRVFSIAVCWSKGSIKCDRLVTFAAKSNPIRIKLKSK